MNIFLNHLTSRILLLVFAFGAFCVSCSHPKAKKASTNSSLESPVLMASIAPDQGLSDGHVWVEKDTVYLICGHDQSWSTTDTWRMDRWEIWTTTDLKQWTKRREILPTDTYIGNHPNCWAGDICKRNEKYYWFFSNKNISTGVMEADTPTGKYRDILGKPLLPHDIIKGHPYDPEIFIEDDVYTICFSAGTYYMATLAPDMKSLLDQPQPVVVLDKKGNRVQTEDKSSLYKRGDWYYLVYGSQYCMSHHLRGPYILQGDFTPGGHTSLFDWKGQCYVIQENDETSLFYRGLQLLPIDFNEDGTLKLPDYKGNPGIGRTWNFDHSSMGWHTITGTTLAWEKTQTALKGTLSSKEATIASALWLMTTYTQDLSFSITIRNSTPATKLRVALRTRKKEPGFWGKDKGLTNWNNEQWVSIDIKAHTPTAQTYTIPLKRFKGLKPFIKQVGIRPAADATSGSWQIDHIAIK